MEVLAMKLHARERWKLRQIEEALRKDDPDLDALLAGQPPPRRPALRAHLPRLQLFWLLMAFLVPVAPLATGLVLHTTWLIVAGAVLCPFIPVITWLPIRRRFPADRRGHRR